MSVSQSVKYRYTSVLIFLLPPPTEWLQYLQISLLMCQNHKKGCSLLGGVESTIHFDLLVELKALMEMFTSGSQQLIIDTAGAFRNIKRGRETSLN